MAAWFDATNYILQDSKYVQLNVKCIFNYRIQFGLICLFFQNIFHEKAPMHRFQTLTQVRRLIVKLSAFTVVLVLSFTEASQMHMK